MSRRIPAGDVQVVYVNNRPWLLPVAVPVCAGGVS